MVCAIRSAMQTVDPEILPPYDETAICPKCGSDDVATLYSTWGMDTCYFMADGTWFHVRGEYLERACQRCIYKWPEQVKTPFSKEEERIGVRI